MVLDRAIGLPILMACAEGGVEIEEVAAKTPEKILKMPVDPTAGLQPYQARRMAFQLGFTGDQAPKAEAIMAALSKIYLEKDATLAEINPLVVRETGEVEVLDGKMTFDDNALFRHPDIEKLRDVSEEDPAELRAGKSGLSYISLNGTIGCLVNGAGLAMSTMDIIKYHGAAADVQEVGRRQQGPGHRGAAHPARRRPRQGRAHQHLRRHHEVRHDRHSLVGGL